MALTNTPAIPNIITLGPRDTIGKIIEINSAIAKQLGIVVEQQKETRKRNEKKDEKVKEYQDKQTETFQKLQGNVLADKLQKVREKLLSTYEKYILKNDLLKFALQGFKNLSQKISNIFWTLFKLFLVMAFLDPKGKILKSIIMLAIRVFKWFLGMIIKHLPMIVKNFIGIVTEVIPSLLKGIVDSFFPKNSPISKFLKGLANLFPVFFVISGVIALLTKIMPYLQSLYNGILKPIFMAASKGKFTLFEKLITKIGNFFGPAGGVLAGIGIFVAYLIAVWKWSKEINKFLNDLPNKIINFFKNIWGWFTKLSKELKSFITIIAIILSPAIVAAGLAMSPFILAIGLFIKFTHMLAKLFNFIKANKKTIMQIIDLFSSMKLIKGGLKILTDIIKKYFINIIIQESTNIIQKIKTGFESIIEKITNPFKDLKGKAGERFKKTIGEINDFMGKIKNIFISTTKTIKEKVMGAFGFIMDMLAGFSAFIGYLARAGTKLITSPRKTLAEAKKEFSVGKEVHRVTRETSEIPRTTIEEKKSQKVLEDLMRAQLENSKEFNSKLNKFLDNVLWLNKEQRAAVKKIVTSGNTRSSFKSRQ